VKFFMGKILLTLANTLIAPRFDLATEVRIISTEGKKTVGAPKSILLPGPSADELCGLILREEVTVLICGGIEEEHYQFLSWKKVKVIDRVIGETQEIVRRFLECALQPGDVVKKTPKI
jgi:predicted Fe-Mo cluster-binding NifX family protein